MRKMYFVLAISTLLSTQSVLADNEMTESKPCAAIAKACLDAGYTRGDDATKKFWQECMKPIVMGKQVTGVTVDAATVKQCRTDKIAQMKKELNELQKQSL